MSARILVVDDSVTIQKVVEMTFSKEDFTLIQARSGEEALRKAKEVRPDLILLDLVMPDKNGYDVCIALRADPMLRAVPIILLAGTFESFDQQRGTQAGANDFVTKPFESQVLIGKVKQLLFSKAVDTRSAAGAPKSPTEAPTLRIPPPPARPEPPTRVVPPPPAEPLPPRPAPAAPSQDDMWQLLDSPSPSIPTAAPAAAPETPGGELRLEEVTAPAAPASPKEPSLDLGPLDLESVEPAPASLVTEAPAVPPAVEAIQSLPESLSLDDLLGSGSGVPTSAPRLDGPAGEPATFEAVFELPPMETPPLPMVEAGKGEPPTLSVEDLLGSLTPAPARDEAGALDFRDLDLTTLPEEPAREEQALSAPAQPEAPFDLEASIGLPLEESAPQVASDLPKETPDRIDALDFLPSVQGIGETPGVAEAAPPELPTEIPPVQAMEEKVSAKAAAMAALDETAFLGAAATLEEVAPPLRAEAPAIDMAAMREEVTARVAHDLTRELSEKLLERFEKIVWEVVPDLAELLISKEIERIRKLADEEKEQSS
jgi:CheY-like chemotaxis protein